MVDRYSMHADPVHTYWMKDPAGGFVMLADYTAIVAARDILQTHFNAAQATIASLQAQVATLQAQLNARRGPTGTGSTRE